MRDERPTDENAGGVGEGVDVALPGDIIRKRHIATRASNRRRIVVITVEGSEFDGYSIGLDDKSLQLLELPSGDVSSIAIEHIVSISDGKPFSSLTPDEKDIVDRRTASFRKLSQNWLVKNWPGVYDRRDEEPSHYQNRQRYTRPPRVMYGRDAEGRTNVDPQVRDRASEG